MPDQFEFVSLDAFKKLPTNERQAYLEKVARYLGALEDGLGESAKKKDPPSPAAN